MVTLVITNTAQSLTPDRHQLQLDWCVIAKTLHKWSVTTYTHLIDGPQSHMTISWPSFSFLDDYPRWRCRAGTSRQSRPLLRGNCLFCQTTQEELEEYFKPVWRREDPQLPCTGKWPDHVTGQLNYVTELDGSCDSHVITSPGVCPAPLQTISSLCDGWDWCRPWFQERLNCSKLHQGIYYSQFTDHVTTMWLVRVWPLSTYAIWKS